MTVRAKFIVNSVEHRSSGNDPKTGEPLPFATVDLGAVYEGAGPDGSNIAKENHIFGKATPSGSLKMGLTNPGAIAYFKPGVCYYLDFTEAGVPAYAKPKSE